MRDFLKYANGDKKFASWLKAVDSIIMDKVEMGLFDLPDMLTRDAFDAGESPKDFVYSTVIDTLREEFGEDILDLFDAE